MTRTSKKTLFTIIGLLALCAFSVTTNALAEGSHHEGHAAGASLTTFWINFLIYVGAAYFILAKHIRNGWAARADSIAAQVNKGAAELEAAKVALANAESTFAKAPDEVKKIQTQIASDAQNECAEIKKEAQARAARIKTQATELIEAEQKATEAAIKRELADLVIKKATEKLSKELNVSNDKPRRDASITGVRTLIQ